jgi:heat shock protein HslJ
MRAPWSFVGVLLLAATAVPSAACGDGAAPAGAVLLGRTFLSDTVTVDGAARPLVAGTRIRIAFLPDGRLTVNAGCNILGGMATVQADRLVVEDLGGTEMGCDPPRHAQDEWIAGVLTADPAYVVDGARLRLSAGTTVVELIDRAVADPDRPLSGTPWVLDGVIDGQSVSSVPAGVRATLRIEGGKLTVAVEGCNGGGTDVQIDADTLQLGRLVMTDMACAAPAASVEAMVESVLVDEVTYTIQAAALTLQHTGGKGLTFRADG